MVKRENTTQGFAIGTILLAVILIAAIVSAVAIASRGTSSSSTREKDRLAAATLAQQSVSISQGIQRMLASGVAPENIVGSFNFTAGSNNSYGLLNYINDDNIIPCTADVRGRTCLYTATAAPSFSQSMFDDKGSNSIIAKTWLLYYADFQIQDTGRNFRTFIAVMGDVTDGICRNFNNIINGAALNQSPPRVTAMFDYPNKFMTSSTDQFTGAFGANGPVQVSNSSLINLKGGCVEYDFFLPTPYRLAYFFPIFSE